MKKKRLNIINGFSNMQNPYDLQNSNVLNNQVNIMQLSITTDYAKDTGNPSKYLKDIVEAGFTHIQWCHQAVGISAQMGMDS